MTEKYSFDKAVALTKLGKLPSSFDQWDARGEDGRTVAHMAVVYNQLPISFNQWWLADKNGVTVAHYVAGLGTLPEDFKQWDLADEDGRTVALEPTGPCRSNAVYASC